LLGSSKCDLAVTPGHGAGYGQDIMSGPKSNIKEAKTLVIRNKIKDSQGFRPGSRAMVKAKIGKRGHVL
jgi:hypothetical protein